MKATFEFDFSGEDNMDDVNFKLHCKAHDMGMFIADIKDMIRSANKWETFQGHPILPNQRAGIERTIDYINLLLTEYQLNDLD